MITLTPLLLLAIPLLLIVHVTIGGIDQLSERGRCFGIKRSHSDGKGKRKRHVELHIFQVKLLAQPRKKRVDARRGCFDCKSNEFISTEASDDIRVAKSRYEGTRRSLKSQVALRVAEGA